MKNIHFTYKKHVCYVRPTCMEMSVYIYITYTYFLFHISKSYQYHTKTALFLYTLHVFCMHKSVCNGVLSYMNKTKALSDIF